MRTRILSAALALLIAAPLAAQSRPSGDAIAAAKRFLDAAGVARVMVATMQAAIPAQRQATPQLPAEFWTRFEQRMHSDLPMLVDSIAVVYATQFTVAELDGLTAFFLSPLGQRFVQAQTALTTESMAVGQRWGMRIGAEIGATLRP